MGVVLWILIENAITNTKHKELKKPREMANKKKKRKVTPIQLSVENWTEWVTREQRIPKVDATVCNNFNFNGMRSF